MSPHVPYHVVMEKAWQHLLLFFMATFAPLVWLAFACAQISEPYGSFGGYIAEIWQFPVDATFPFAAFPAAVFSAMVAVLDRLPKDPAAIKTRNGIYVSVIIGSIALLLHAPLFFLDAVNDPGMQAGVGVPLFAYTLPIQFGGSILGYICLYALVWGIWWGCRNSAGTRRCASS